MLIAKGARVDSVALLDVELLTEDMLEMLVAHGADVNIADDIGRTPLMEATRLDKADFAKFLITHGARVDARDSEGMTALMIASANARPKAARLLVSHGADVNAKDKVGWTPLMYAAACRSAEISKLLISHGAHMNATGTKTGDSADMGRIALQKGTREAAPGRRGPREHAGLPWRDRANMDRAFQ